MSLPRRPYAHGPDVRLGVAESQIESLVTAKGYADCVVFMGAESVSVVVAPPEGGLTATDAARIKDIVISETDYTAEQIKIMEAN